MNCFKGILWGVGFSLVLWLVIGLVVVGIARADKTLTVSEMRDVRGQILFNIRDDSAGVYYPIVIEFGGFAEGDDISLRVNEVIAIGTPQATEFTPHEIYDVIKTKFGQTIADKLKSLYIKGINEDISQ